MKTYNRMTEKQSANLGVDLMDFPDSVLWVFIGKDDQEYWYGEEIGSGLLWAMFSNEDEQFTDHSLAQDWINARIG